MSLEGFVYAPNAADDQIKTFQFIYNVTVEHWKYPTVQQRIFCTIADGGAINNPGMYAMVRISGTLHVGIQRDGAGKIDSVYRMDVDRLTPVP